MYFMFVRKWKGAETWGVYLGYLAFDSRTSKVFIPNTELLGEFRIAIESEQ